LATELTHTDPGDSPGQAPVAQHPGDMQIRRHDRAVGSREPGRHLVQALAAGVGHGSVQRGHAGLGPQPPPRRLLPAAAVGAGTARGLA
jgi:hypothetical protein